MNYTHLDPHVKSSLNTIKSLYQNGDILQLSFSGGKDSTALLGLLFLAKRLGIIENFQVAHSNTLMEMPFLNAHVDNMISLCKKNDIEFIFLTAPLKDRFMYNVFGRGLAIPNRNFRWCTDRLKVKPIKNNINDNVIMITGERLGESQNRDRKLKGCGGNGECGVKEQSKNVSKVSRPIINWSTCQVWDFIAEMDIYEILPDVFSKLSDIYSINQNDNGSMRTGCIGCPLVNKDKSLDAFVKKHNEFEPLSKVHEIYQKLTLEEHRLIRNIPIDNNTDKGKPLGAIRLTSRLIAFNEILSIEKEVQKKVPNFVLVEHNEKNEIIKSLNDHTYPKGYSKDEQQIVEDIEQYEVLKAQINLK